MVLPVFRVVNHFHPLSSCKSSPLSQEAVEAFESLKLLIEKTVVTAIDEHVPFEVETDALEVAIAATLNQNGRLVAFFSRTLQGCELKHAAVEKEAQAIIKAIHHWRHFLTGRYFTLKTDQKYVSYMFDAQHKGKIKNNKILCFKLELACYSFDTVYRPGKSNIPPDTLSRATCATESGSLYSIHQSLCHSGVTRLYHEDRAETKALIGGCIFIYSLSADEFLLKSTVMTTDFKRNSSGRTRIYEYTPPPPMNALVSALHEKLKEL